MSEHRELLLGCGHARDKRLGLPGEKLQWRGLVTLDRNWNVGSDLICDLNGVPWTAALGPEAVSPYSDDGTAMIDFFSDPPHQIKADFFDEVHAYEVLEHLGSQGDAAAFFACFTEIWRVLKSGGHLFATVPSRYSPWLWGDPSHRRAILPEALVFLNQLEYIKQCDGPVKTPMSDFRDIYKADFDIVASHDNQVTHMFCLKAVKPSRIKA